VKVAVGGLIHDRWTVDLYLDAIEALRPPKDCEIMRVWVADGNYGNDLPGLRVIVDTLPGRHYHRDAGVPARNESERHMFLREIYGRMAALRNVLAEVALGMDCDALLSIDSDIIVPADLVERLVATGKPWVAPLVRNAAEGATPRGHWNVFKLYEIERQAGLVDHFRPIGPNFPPPEGTDHDPRDRQKGRCLAAGACCLYSRELLEKVRWRTDARGRQEDVGFAIGAFEAGFRAWYIPLVCRHLTVDGLEVA